MDTQEWDGSRSPMKYIMDSSCIIHREIERQMADLNLSSIQSRILGYLYFQAKQSRQVFQRELEEEFKIRKSSVTSVLQGLEKRGLVRRVGVPGDGRQKELILTEQGILVQETVIGRLNALEEKVNGVLSPEEQQEFIACMKKMETRLKEAEYD